MPPFLFVRLIQYYIRHSISFSCSYSLSLSFLLLAHLFLLICCVFVLLSLLYCCVCTSVICFLLLTVVIASLPPSLLYVHNYCNVPVWSMYCTPLFLLLSFLPSLPPPPLSPSLKLNCFVTHNVLTHVQLYINSLRVDIVYVYYYYVIHL